MLQKATKSAGQGENDDENDNIAIWPDHEQKSRNHETKDFY